MDHAVFLLAASIPGGGIEQQIPALVAQAGPVVKGVMLLTLLLSVYSWALIFQKMLAFRKARRALREATLLMAQPGGIGDVGIAHARLRGSPWGSLLAAAYAEAFGKNLPGESFIPSGGEGSREDYLERMHRALDRAATAERDRFERGVLSLGTVANVSPFLGLFGTVWGIMNSFLSIGLKETSSIAAVGPGIAEALIATAAGLAAAIPAAVAYNHFLARLRAMEGDLESLSGLILDKARYGEKAAGEAKRVSYSL
ncbi:MAG: MotA/TolQ/ExbB proton channel family protein [bacterium]